MESKNNQSIKSRAVDGMVWKLSEKAGMQLVQFIVQIVMARLLSPDEFGVVGLLIVFIAISEPFISQGFTTALIQKKKIDDIDLSSVYWTNIFLGFIIYCILFVTAPVIAWFYDNNQLTLLMRVLSISIIAGAFGAVHNAILIRNLDFKKSFFRNLFNIGTQAIVGIILALNDMGPWALVMSKVAGTVVGSIALIVSVKWKPSKMISKQRLTTLFSYSSKVFATSELNVIFNNLSSLVIGKSYTSEDLGFYQKGQQFPQVIMNAVDGSFNEVLYPTLASIQDNKNYLKSALRRSLKTSMFIVLPVMIGLMATSDTLVNVLLTEKWLSSVPFLRIQCIICALWPLSANINALNAIGKSNITLKISLISKFITLVLIILGLQFGIYAILLSTLIADLISIIIVTIYTKKYIEYCIWEMLEDIGKSMFTAMLMGGLVFIISYITIPNIVKLIIQIMAGIGLYILLSILMKNDSFDYLLNIIRSFISRIGKKNNERANV